MDEKKDNLIIEESFYVINYWEATSEYKYYSHQAESSLLPRSLEDAKKQKEKARRKDFATKTRRHQETQRKRRKERRKTTNSFSEISTE